jgi:murein DD-endopeptidase MepM/ murein hydrolase activator NlpD
MDNKKTTILIISYDDNGVKSININTHFVKNYKKYIAGLTSMFILFVTGLFAFIFHANGIRIENNSLTNEISELHRNEELLDSLKLKDKLNKIDGNLSLIRSYLLSRGIPDKGDGETAIQTQYYTRYYKVRHMEEQSDVFLKSVLSIPLGLPHYGPVSSEYGYRKNPFGGYIGEFHPGIDIKGSPGDNVYATAEGIVISNDWYGGYGNAVVIDHGNGLRTLYGHLSGVNVVPGQRVKTGDTVGFLGSTGRSTGPHVHYEIRKDGVDIDPVPFLTLNYQE